jgi:hypothetical protein
VNFTGEIDEGASTLMKAVNLSDIYSELQKYFG